MKKIVPIFERTFSQFGEDKATRLAAALAYYAMFSIGPLLVIAVGVAGIAMGKEHVRHQVQDQLQNLLGSSSAQTVESMMSARKPGTSLITTIVGIVALLFGAAGVFGQLQDALNTVWEVKSKPGAGIWGFIRARFLSLTMVLGIGFLLLVSMVLTTILSAGMGAVGGMLPLGEALAHALNFIVSFGVISLLFAVIFKYLPDVKIPFRVVWPGAILTSFLFTVGKYGLAMYLGRESTASAYGAAGSVIIIMMWVYYASLILLFGAEFTHAYAKETKTAIVPNKFAIPVSREQRAQEGMEENKAKGAKKKGKEDDAPGGLPADKPGLAAALVAAQEDKIQRALAASAR